MVDRGVLLWLAAVYLIAVALIISVVDSRRMMIPNALNAANAIGGFVFTVSVGAMPFVTCLLGGLFGFVTLLAFRLTYKRIRGREGLGLGDVKYMAGAGLWVGWPGLAPLLLVSSLSALLFLVFRSASSARYNPQEELPFGPFLCIGTLTIWATQTADIAPWIIP